MWSSLSVAMNFKQILLEPAVLYSECRVSAQYKFGAQDYYCAGFDSVFWRPGAEKGKHFVFTIFHNPPKLY
eukprot:scaffold504_cov189-Ochromonas_danica.AAC.46